jgi:hypothetical protein
MRIDAVNVAPYLINSFASTCAARVRKSMEGGQPLQTMALMHLLTIVYIGHEG